MATGTDLYNLLCTRIGGRYAFGVVVPKDDPTYKSPFDCAEFASWGVFQLSGKLYGCANNAGNPHGADAYSGFWIRDAHALGKIIPVQAAAAIKGAFVLRMAGDGIIGHVACSDGNGGTVEAHSTRTGIIRNVITGRRWDLAVMIPWITYTISGHDVDVHQPADKIYRVTSPYMHDDYIKKIQRKLGFATEDIDGTYGPKTFGAVREFQIIHGLNPDGEVGPETSKALNI